MEYQVARRLVLVEGTNTTEYSRPVPMGPNVEFYMTAQLYYISGSSPTLTINAEVSNDLENWYSAGLASISFTSTCPDKAEAYGSSSQRAKYARVKYVVGSTQTDGRAIVAVALSVGAP